MSISTSVKHSGTASFEAVGTNTNVYNRKNFLAADGNSAYWFRFYLYVGSFASPNTLLPIFCLSSLAGSNDRGCVYLQTSHVLQLQVGGTTINGSTVLTTSTWYRIEWAYNDTTPTSTVTSMRLNGVTEIASTTVNIGSGAGIQAFMYGLVTAGSYTFDYYFDDFAINGNSTRSDNWPGDGSIVNILPGAVGDNSAWTATGTCTGGNYGCVNERHQNGNTNYVTTSTASALDDYGLSSFTSAGITAGDQIKLVSVGVVATTAGVTKSSVINTRLKASSGGTTTTSANLTFTSDGGYVYNADDGVGVPALTAYTLPGTNTPWSTSNLTTTQIGINRVSGGAATRVTAMYLLVEYSPSSGGRLWSNGAELQSVTSGVEITNTSGGTTPTISTSTKRSGAASYNMDTTGGAAQSVIYYDWATSSAVGDYFVRAYVNAATYPSSTASIISIRDVTSGGSRVDVQMTSTGTLQLRDSQNAANIGSASTAKVSQTGWTRIEVEVNDTTLASTSVALHMDGASISSGTINITNGVGRYLMGVSSTVTANLFFDDLAINQNIGTTQNSWPGDGNITYLRPNAAGDNIGWTKNGSCTGGTNPSCINETTPDDATSYVSATTANTLDDYNVANSGLASTDTITLLQVGVRFSTASATEEDFRIRLKDASGGVAIESSNINVASTTWRSNKPSGPFNYSLTAYTRPEQSSAWTPTTVDSAQIGIRDFNAGTGTIQVSNVWLLVEYTPSIAGTVYDTDESSAITSQPTVRVKVNGVGSYTTTAAANGTYSIASVGFGLGDALTVYLDTNGGIGGATFTISTAGDLTGIDIYKDRAATRCDNSCSLTNTAINYWDKDDDSDIHAAVSGSNLTVDNDWKLLVKANTFAPGGTVTTSAGGSNTYSGDVEIKSGTTLNMAGNALSIGGSYLNSGTFTSSSNTTTFTSTASTETIGGTLSGGSALYNVIFNGSGGVWTLSAAPTISNNLTLTAGTVVDGGNQITGNASGTFTMASGTTLKLGTSGTATTFPATFTGPNTTLNSGSLVVYNATVAQTISGVPTYGNLQLSAASGTPTKTLAAATTIAGNLTIDSSNTLDDSSGNNYAVSLAGNYTNNGTFTARNGTLTLNGSGAQTLAGTMTSSSAFYNLTISNSSGTVDPACGTSFTPGVSFSGSATVSNNYVITTASVKVQYNSGSTYTATNINWNGQAAGTKIQFRNSSLSSGTWLLNVSGTQTAVSYVDVGRSDASGGSQIAANDGTNTDCNNNTNWNFGTTNHSPNSPTSLTQKRTTAGTTLSTGDWTNETKATFTVTADDTDNPDTLQLCVEVIPIASTFTNSETGCGSGVAYSGTPVTLTYNNTTISDATEYKWQARVKDTAAAYSAWVDYGSNSNARDFGVDTTAPTTGTVYDGTTTNVESTYNDSSLTTISANWSGWNSNVSGLSFYEYSLGTAAGGTSLIGWTNNGTSTTVTANSLNLHTNQPYYFNVRATDNAGNVSNVVSSSGQYVLPQLTFSLSSNSVTFSNLNSANNLQDSKTTTLTTSTNAYGGYVISAYSGGLLSSGSTTIPAFAAGSYATPASWGSGLCSGSSCGFGYTSSDTTINGSNKFSGGTLYAPFSSLIPGDVVADHTTAVNGTSGAVVNESFTITCKLAVSSLQPSLTYSGTIYYIATGTF